MDRHWGRPEGPPVGSRHPHPAACHQSDGALDVSSPVNHVRRRHGGATVGVLRCFPRTSNCDGSLPWQRDAPPGRAGEFSTPSVRATRNTGGNVCACGFFHVLSPEPSNSRPHVTIRPAVCHRSPRLVVGPLSPRGVRWISFEGDRHSVCCRKRVISIERCPNCLRESVETGW